MHRAVGGVEPPTSQEDDARATYLSRRVIQVRQSRADGRSQPVSFANPTGSLHIVSNRPYRNHRINRILQRRVHADPIGQAMRDALSYAHSRCASTACYHVGKGQRPVKAE